MTAKVKTPYLSNFRFPPACVVCGNPPGPGMTWKISGSKSNWSGKQTTTLSLGMPLCQECHSVSQNKKLAKFLTIMGTLVTIMLCLIMAVLVGSGTIENTFLGVVIGLVVIIGFILLVNWLANSVNQKDFTPEQRERRKRVRRCAKITSFKSPGLFDKTGAIVFEFENPEFARLFSVLNLGELS
jgi:hypothetical protein